MQRLRTAGYWLLLTALIIATILIDEGGLQQEEIRAGSGERVRVIDGDSLRIGDREIRIAGIDAPEYRQTCEDEGGAEWPCGREARAALETIAGEGGLSCTKAAEDRYGRALAHCRTKGGDLAGKLAEQGWALDARDNRFEAPHSEIAHAKRQRLGIWRGTHQHPADWRKRNP